MSNSSGAGRPTVQDAYTLGSAAHRQFISRRSAATHAAFLLPHLKPGMRLLDAGCGGGSITVGLAEAVSPGEALGIDVDARQLELAAALARERGLSNARFESASIYDLPYPDDSFDAAFCHAVFMHLSDPLRALGQLRRVLRPGGILGLRESDERGTYMAPEHPDIGPRMRFFQELLRHAGGDPLVGGRLKELLRRAEFGRVEIQGVYDTYATPEAVRAWAGMIDASVHDARNCEQYIRLGIATQEQLLRVGRAWQEWARNPDAFYVRAYVQALGWKE